MVASSRFDGEARSVKCEEENWLGRKKRGRGEIRRRHVEYWSTLLPLHFPQIHGCVCLCVCEEIGIKKYLLFFNFLRDFLICVITFSFQCRSEEEEYVQRNISRFIIYLYYLYYFYQTKLFVYFSIAKVFA